MSPTHDASLTAIGKKLDAIEVKLDEMNGRLADGQTRMSLLEHRVAKLDSLDGELREARKNLALHELRVEKIEAAEAARAGRSAQHVHDWRRAGIDLVKQILMAAACFAGGLLIKGAP